MSAAICVGRETSEVLTAVSNDSVEGGESVLPPIVGKLMFGMEYSDPGRGVADCLGVAW